MESFLAGDPLRSIAAAANMDSYRMLHLLGSRVADRAEQQRSKAIRDRCIATGAALYQERERFKQLMGAGIDLADIPRVLAALGASVDVDFAVEMLRSMRMFKEILHRVLQQNGVIEVSRSAPTTDELSLLYVTGLHRGVKPNYELALGMMPVSSFADLRELLGTRHPYQRTAEILAVTQATSQAVRAGDVTGISFTEYAKLADEISMALECTARPGVSWPVPAEALRHRLGQGTWDAALGSAGLRLSSTRRRFSHADFVEAAEGFRNAYGDFGSPKDVASYDSWIIAEMAAGRDRPSVVAIRRHFGAWESVIGAVMPPEVEDEYEGLVNLVRAESNVQEGWAKAGELISEVLANMPWNSFLSVDYGDESDGPNRPYAQASPSADGVWCEIVSEEFLTSDQWPINTDYLARNGWSAPDEEVPNWHKQGIPSLEAGHQILEGLAYGRICHDPQRVRWHSADFPGGPGPDGGAILDAEPGGAVRNLRNVS
jgi:hypothetical protein